MLLSTFTKSAIGSESKLNKASRIELLEKGSFSSNSEEPDLALDDKIEVVCLEANLKTA